MSEITEDSKAPVFDIPADNGGRATLDGPTAIFFYPKADTPSCTNEAVDFSTRAADFAALGVTVIGISRDPVKKLDRFKAKHDLHVILGSDEAGAVTDAYGVWVLKTLYGREYMGIERATFLIDGEGVVRRVWRQVRVKDHADAVLAAAREL
ncbi:peroxiredoxin [Brevundimonas sp. NIBR11]|uniref:peroxiredoxin n=1 Tax=Brevundimonas sp. NIBR11 TaxID=3015999 RepID=UPI0022F06174|nr:peroxiredoxin [Brevundimonas sp. NIBR11]WGM30946.1 Putative peroxiredoxin bcp [Brevundimonas sp. NIBR11]